MTHEQKQRRRELRTRTVLRYRKRYRLFCATVDLDDRLLVLADDEQVTGVAKRAEVQYMGSRPRRPAP